MRTFAALHPSSSRRFLYIAILGLGLGSGTIGCDPNGPFNGNGPGGYNDPYYGNNNGNGYANGFDPRNDRERNRIERDRRRLDQERDQIENDRDRLARERNEQQRQQQWQQEQQARPPRQESCPSGFSPSENKCSREERRRGCKDMRLPSGLGCVRR